MFRYAAVVTTTMLLWGCASADEPATPSEDSTEEPTEATAADPEEDADETGDGDTTADDAVDDAADDAAGGDDEGEAADETGDPSDFGDVALTLESVTDVTWEEDDGAFEYEVSVGGEIVDTSFGPPFILLEEHGASDDVSVEALDMEGASLGEFPVTTTSEERLIVRWDEARVESAYVGLSATGFGSMTAAVQPPYVVEPAPDTVDTVLFGEMVSVEEEAEDGVSTTFAAPFEFDGGSIVEHGPYMELPVP